MIASIAAISRSSSFQWIHMINLHICRMLVWLVLDQYDYPGASDVILKDRGNMNWYLSTTTLQWRHAGRDGVSNNQPHHFLLNRLFRRRSKKTSKLRVTGLWVGNSPVTGEFPTQMAGNAVTVSIWWRHHETWQSASRVHNSLILECWSNIPIFRLVAVDSGKLEWLTTC